MKKLCLLLAALIVLSGFAKVNNLIGFGSQKADAPASVSFLQLTTDAVNRTTYTLNSVNFGAPVAGRVIIIAVHYRKDSDRTLVSATIGDITATIATSSGTTGTLRAGAAIIHATIPTGTSGTVEIIFSGGMHNCEIHTYRAVDLASSTVHAADNDQIPKGSVSSVFVNIDIPANGFVVAGSNKDEGTGETATWTGVNEDDETPTEAKVVSSASQQDLSVETLRTIDAAWTGTNRRLEIAAASWQ